MLRIGFATTDWSTFDRKTLTLGGSGHYRIGMPARFMTDAGHDVFIGGIIRGKIDGRLQIGIVRPELEDSEPDLDDPEQVAWGLDVVVMQRMWHAGLADRIREARAGGQRIVADVDDHLWNVDGRNHARGWMTPSNLALFTENISACDLVTVSTRYLADVVRHRCDVPVVVVPNVVDLDAGWIIRPQPARPTIGWAGALPWRSGDIETMKGVLGPLLVKHRLRFHHAGDRPADGKRLTFAYQADLPKTVKVTTTGMVRSTEIPRLYDHFDIGIVPLSGVPFNEAKSYIKGLEMAAAGIPFVAQATGEYKRLADAGIGLVATTKNQWRGAIERLLNVADRAEIAAEARVVVEREFSAQACWPLWEQVLCTELAGVS